tara:strand:+ start:748 stop:927 length:180 start_codon:yes stop_codon:yes gene_type:complete
MKDVYKTKVYNLLEGISSRAKLLDDGITGVRKIDNDTARNLIAEVSKLTEQTREMIDIS